MQKTVTTAIIILIVIASTFFLFRSLNEGSQGQTTTGETKSVTTQSGEKQETQQQSKQEPVQKKNIQPTKGCEDECSTDVCNGRRFIACERDDQGCRKEVDKGVVIGKCEVACTTDADCNTYQACQEYVCVREEKECGNDVCELGEFGQCTQDCGEADSGFISAYPAFLFDAQGKLKDNVWIVVGNAEPAYQMNAAERLINDLKGVAPGIESRIKRAGEIGNIPQKVLVMLGTECDNEILGALGMQCSPFSASISPYLEIVGSQITKLIVYGNENTLNDSVDALLSARQRKVQASREQVS